MMIKWFDVDAMYNRKMIKQEVQSFSDEML